MTPEEIADLVECERPEPFWSLMRVENIQGGAPVPFTNLSPEQLDMTERRLACQENAYLKSRQVGAGLHTQAFDLWWVWRHAWMGQCINTFITAHSRVTAARHIERLRLLNLSLPPAIRLPMLAKREFSIEFGLPGHPGIVSRFNAATADGKNGEGRGDTYQRWHGTECAFYDDLDGVYASVTSAIQEGPHKSITLETTPNGETGAYPNLYKKFSYSPTKCAVFYSWTMNPRHSLHILDDKVDTFVRDMDEDEKDLQRDGVRLDQLAWRRQKLEGFTKEKFKKEYPYSVAEAFQSSGATAIASPRLQAVARSNAPSKSPSGWREFCPPRQGVRYVVAVDSGWGMGEDYSVIQVFTTKMEQVAVWSDNTTKPGAVGEIAWMAALRYNSARVIVEYNNVGMVVGDRIVKDLRGRIYCERGKPFTLHTHNRSTFIAYSVLQFEQDRPRIRDWWTASEILALRPDPNGKLVAGPGNHDDHAMAAFHALWLCKHAATLDTDEFAEGLAALSPPSRVTRQYASS